jgi:rubrerythrin
MKENNDNVSELFPEEIIMADGDYVCPVCNQGKMVLTGRKTLGFPVDRKKYCPLCLHEEDF